MRESLEIHLLCIARTGSGKSLIFEELARVPGAQTLIVSPLRALVRQQTERLRNLGITLGEDFQPFSRTTSLRAPLAIVLTPEELAARLDRGWRIPAEVLLVVDECHCIDSWGEHFRPEFSLIPGLIQKFGIRKSLWLTATLSAKAKARLIQHISRPVRELGEFSLPPSLQLQKIRVPLAQRPGFLSHWLSHHLTPGIVFCATRVQCERVGRFMRERLGPDRGVATYHSGLAREQRLQVEQGLQTERIQTLAATSAFGMGMNYRQLRWVVLWQVPYSIPDLAQMLGRAGRVEAETAHAAMLWDDADFLWLKNRVDPKTHESLEALYRTQTSPHDTLRHYFDTTMMHSAGRTLPSSTTCATLVQHYAV